MNYITFAEIIGKGKIEKFKRIKDFLSSKYEDFFTLFHTWEYFQNSRGQDTFSDSTDGKIQNENQSLTFNGNDLDIPTGTHDGGERMTADQDANLESGTPKVDNRKVYQLKVPVAICHVENLCTAEPHLLQELSALNILVNSLCGLRHQNAKVGDGLKDNHLQ
jgi:hypothetical protein